jgi:hypothetical protein
VDASSADERRLLLGTQRGPTEQARASFAGTGARNALSASTPEYSDAGTRKARFHTACGSANEVRGGVFAAQAWGYVSAAICVVATLYKLTH